ncbi:His Kinase A (phospho-acceptor) domain-containing protein [Micromonospora pattaloongensis]|uniref:histidine kinase n=1 Tax=Micromonospora pattaloongensis TaxID=405436 RepID=A0A1H3N249_9ACTN|nr:HAMP domain-containing sensor histidine kinase [Micromonospora pattaloongensis]SDY82309.1 His Kinase A (phospho-acceptor) domain-containing protein [Micromonospora pattaloongensis]
MAVPPAKATPPRPTDAVTGPQSPRPATTGTPAGATAAGDVPAAAMADVIHSLDIGILVEDADRNPLLANAAFAEMFEAGTPELPAASTELHLPDGRVVHGSHRTVPLDGAAPGELWTFRDVTADVHARREVDRERQRLAELKARFIATASHELRTPLTTISTLAQMLGDGLPSHQELATTVDAIQRNSQRMLLLVDDLTLLSRIESGDLRLEPTPVDLARLVQDTGTRLRELLPQAPARIAPGAGPLLNGDERLLRQLLYAVAGIVAATQGSVSVSTHVDQNGWTVTASAPAATPLTDEYLLAATLPTLDAEARRRSVALWLLIAHAIAMRHQGVVTTSAEPSEGTRVRVQLPLI